ncbi:MAG: hypothetical protein ACFCGT_00255 [Sandaracinaceae bacterium]
MRFLALFVLAFLLLVVQGAVAVVFPLGAWAPNLLLPFVLYLGVSPDIPLVRGALLAFLAGYLLDIFSGFGLSLSAFVLLSTYLASRGSGLSLFLRGPFFQIGLTFAIEILAGGMTLALQAIFEPPPPFAADTVPHTVRTLAAGAAITALVSPLLYAGMARLDSALVRRREEGGAT